VKGILCRHISTISLKNSLKLSENIVVETERGGRKFARRELLFCLIGEFSLPSRAVSLSTRRRVFHFVRLRNQIKNSSGAPVGTHLPFLFATATDFRARTRSSFRMKNGCFTDMDAK